MPVTDRPNVIIHAGFHKTGTTSVQRALEQNRDALRDYRILLKDDIPDLCAAADAYARKPDADNLARFTAVAVQTFIQTDQRPTVISAEDLTGLIPGRKQRQGYPVAVPLLRALIGACADYAPHIYLSTRNTAPWLKSCHAHHLRHARCRQSLSDYSAAQADKADLSQIAQDISAALSPIPVSHCALEQATGMAQGPLTPLLDLMRIPETVRATLRPVAAANVSLPQPILDAMLELNQSGLDQQTLTARKKALIADYRRTIK